MYSSNSLLIHKKDTFLGFSSQVFEKNISEGILGKIDQNFLPRLANLAIKGFEGWLI